MAMYPNGRYMTLSPGRHFGPGVGLEVYARGMGDRLDRFVSNAYARTASTPDGYDIHGAVPAIKAGSMTARRPLATTSGTGNLLNGGPMSGSASVCTVTQEGGLSLVVSLSGTAQVFTLSGNGVTVSLTIGLSGTATVSVGGNASLSMIVPFSGTGAVTSMGGNADLKGNLSMSGEWTPFSELSPQNLAREIWNAVAAQYNDTGTMGAKLNTASSGGVDLEALAQAVLAAAQVTPIHADQRKVNGVTVVGTGTEADPWGPAA